LGDRLVVKTGDLAVVVEDIAGTIERIGRLAKNYSGGYVVSSQAWREGERTRGTISIRVPAGDFEAAVASIAGMAEEVTQRTATSKDVTEEYTDLTARLKNLEAAEQQLLKIMAQAQKVEDVLAVQRELTRVRGEIEQTKGRIQYLERTTATSLINVRLEQSKLEVRFSADATAIVAGQVVRFSPQIVGGFTPYSYQWDFGDGATSTISNPSHSYSGAGVYSVALKVTDDRKNAASQVRSEYITVMPGWNAGDIVASAWSGLVSFGQGLASVLIWAGILSPIWIIIGVVAWWLVRRQKRGSGGTHDRSVNAPPGSPPVSGVSSKSRLVTVLLAVFLGVFGAHRFYAGRIVTAALMLALFILGLATTEVYAGPFLIGAVSVWVFVDFIMACVGKMRDGGGRLVMNWSA
jgi:TM2 domain-containing membrane protein YozV